MKQNSIYSYAGFFLSKMLGTRYGPVGTRFVGFWGSDFLGF